MAKPTYQGPISGTQERKTFADDSYKDLRIAEFHIQLTANHYMNFHNVHLVFLLKNKKSTNVANNILATEIHVNNFFAHWRKEIDIIIIIIIIIIIVIIIIIIIIIINDLFQFGL